jgi:hypothetical protein
MNLIVFDKTSRERRLYTVDKKEYFKQLYLKKRYIKAHISPHNSLITTLKVTNIIPLMEVLSTDTGSIYHEMFLTNKRTTVNDFIDSTRENKRYFYYFIRRIGNLFLKNNIIKYYNEKIYPVLRKLGQEQGGETISTSEERTEEMGDKSESTSIRDILSRRRVKLSVPNRGITVQKDFGEISRVGSSSETIKLFCKFI